MSWSAKLSVSVAWLTTLLLLGLVAATFWPHTSLHAVATDRSDTFAMATGACDQSVEAVWLLDCLTGDLGAMVVSKQAGKFNAVFTRNILMDLGVDMGKNPKFQMTTGVADLRRRGGAGMAPSNGLLYVAEITTGKVAVYSIPWSATNWVQGMQQTGQIVLLDCKRFRNAAAMGKGKAAAKEEE